MHKIVLIIIIIIIIMYGIYWNTTFEMLNTWVITYRRVEEEELLERRRNRGIE